MKQNISNQDLQERINEIYDYAYTNSPVRTPTTIGKEVGKLLHIGMYIEEIDNKKPAFSFSNTDLKMLRGGQNLLIAEFYSEIIDKYNEMNKLWKIYPDDLLFTAQNIAYICAELNNILISDHERDVFGDALEVFRSKWIKQEGGQFFTDQKVTSLAMHLLQFDPRKGDDLVDLCAGTGGFILAGLKHTKSLVEQDPKITEHEIIDYAKRSLKGQEIDSEVARVGNATLSARLGESNFNLISNGNSLDREAFQGQTRIKFGNHSCAATNPPFGAKITIKDTHILNQYDLAKISNSDLDVKSGRLYRRAPDILFIEQNINLLKPEIGKLAIVIPYQILSGPQTFYVRHWLLKHVKLLAVIDLPSETFQPHTGTKTALVLLQKRAKPLNDFESIHDEEVFMSIPRWIGHDRRGNPIYRSTQDGKVSHEILSDFEEVRESYLAYLNNQSFEHIHEQSFTITCDKILEDNLLRINAQYHATGESENRSSLNDTIFDKIQIKNVVKRIFYPGRFKRTYVDKYEKAVPFLGGSNITQLIVETEKWFRHDDPKLDQLQVKEGWILITRSGTTGIVSSVPKSWDGFAMSEHVIRIIPDNEKLDAGYLQAFLKTTYCQAQIAKSVFGSVIDEITPESIGEIEVLIPKDKKKLATFIAQMKKSEQAKEEAISHLYGTVNELNDLLSN